MRPVDPQKVLITRTDNSMSLIALQGAGIPKITDGFGGWQILARARKTGLTLYQGKNPFKMQLSLMFDGYMDNISQERNIRTLIWMGLPPEGEHEPVPVLLYGTLPFPSGGPWVIDNLDFGDQVYWKGTERVRQDVTVTFMQYNRIDRVEFTMPGIGLAPKTPTTHIVRDGDTIRRLAQFYYGDYRRWHDIAAANALEDPANLTVGRPILIP